MAVVRETKLPGVGVRHNFATETGAEVGVLVYRNGRRQIVVYDTDDPDECTSMVTLSAADTRTLSELLGASQVNEAVGEVLHGIQGLAIEWITVNPGSSAIGVSIADGDYRAKTGVSIVAVVREGSSIPAPGSDFALAVEDVIVAVGTLEGLADLRQLVTPK